MMDTEKLQIGPIPGTKPVTSPQIGHSGLN